MPDVPLILLAAHYDTVPAQGNIPGRIEDGAVHGLGASDMKGGLAVALELARDRRARRRRRVTSAFCSSGARSFPPSTTHCRRCSTASSLVHEATLAIVLEPTDLMIQAGCLGNVVARLTFHGTSGHAARPWLADSALERAVRELAPFFEREARTAVVNGLEFREVISVTRLAGGDRGQRHSR